MTSLSSPPPTPRLHGFFSPPPFPLGRPYREFYKHRNLSLPSPLYSLLPRSEEYPQFFLPTGIFDSPFLDCPRHENGELEPILGRCTLLTTAILIFPKGKLFLSSLDPTKVDLPGEALFPRPARKFIGHAQPGGDFPGVFPPPGREISSSLTVLL